MKTIEVIILEGGVTAKEVNPFGVKKPTSDLTYTKGNTVIIGTEKEHIYKAQLINWEKAEKELRTFEIDSEEDAIKAVLEEKDVNFEIKLTKEDKIKSAHVIYNQYTKYKAILLPSGKIKITPDNK